MQQDRKRKRDSTVPISARSPRSLLIAQYVEVTPSPARRLRLRLFTPIECRCNPRSIGKLVQVYGARACARMEQIISMLPRYAVDVSRLLACCGSIRATSSFHSSGAAFCTRLDKVGRPSVVISFSASNFPNPTSGSPTARSSVRIRVASAVLPMVRMSSETHASRSTTSFRWYIASDSAFARAEPVMPYFFVGSSVTRWYTKSLIDHRCFSNRSHSTISTLSRLVRPLTYLVGFLGEITPLEGVVVEGVVVEGVVVEG